MESTKTPCDASWTIKKLFQLRRVGQPFSKHIVGNALSNFIWHGNGNPLGPSLQRFEDRMVVTHIWNLNAKVYHL